MKGSPGFFKEQVRQGKKHLQAPKPQPLINSSLKSQVRRNELLTTESSLKDNRIGLRQTYHTLLKTSNQKTHLEIYICKSQNEDSSNHTQLIFGRQMQKKIEENLAYPSLLFTFLDEYMKFIANLVNTNQFVLNMRLINILDQNFMSYKEKEVDIIDIDTIIKKQNSSIEELLQVSTFLGEMKQVLKNLYIKYGKNEEKAFEYSQEYFRSLKIKHLSCQILDDGIYLQDGQIKQIKEKIVENLKKFMEFQLINQFLLNCRFIIAILKKKFSYLEPIQPFLQAQRWKYKKFQTIINELKNQFLQLAKKFQDDELEKDNRKPPVKPSSRQFEKSDSSNPNSFKQSVQKTSQELKVSTQDKQEKLNGNKCFIKFYETKHTATTTHIKISKQLRYVQVDKQHRQALEIQLFRHQNEMNIIRYFEKLRQMNKLSEFMLKLQIMYDNQSQIEKLPKYTESPGKFKGNIKVFQFESLKADRDFSTYHRDGVKHILKETFLQTKSRKLLYSFFFYFSMIICMLQKYGIHQTDFIEDNFIKFGNIFYMVDLGNAFFVQQKRYTRGRSRSHLNRQFFKSWLNSTNEEATAYYFNYNDYKKIKQKYQDYQGQNKQNFLQACINECIKAMPQKMKMDHFRQFKQTVLDLLKKDIDFLKKEEIKQIQDLLNFNQPEENFYQYFSKNLNKIFKAHNEGPLSEYQSIGESCQLLQDHLKNYSHQDSYDSIVEKTLSINYYFSNFFQGKAKDKICLQQFSKVNNQNILTHKDDSIQAKLQQIISHQRYIYNFLLNTSQILKELEQRGFVALNFDIETFCQYGQQYYLKDLRQIFKIRQDHQNKHQYPKLQYYNRDSELVNLSREILIDIYYDETDNRRKLFSKRIIKRLRDVMLQKQHLNPEERLQFMLFQAEQRLANTLNQEPHPRIKAYFFSVLKAAIREIHINKYRQMARSIFAEAPLKNLKNPILIKLKSIILNNAIKNIDQAYQILKGQSSVISSGSYGPQ